MIDKLYVFSEIPNNSNDEDVSSNNNEISDEKKLKWTINNTIKQKLKNIHLKNNYIEKEEEIELGNKNNNTNVIKKYKIEIDNEFIVKYNNNLVENNDIKNHNNNLILKEGYYYYVYIYKYNNNVFFDIKNNKLNLISSKSNPILGAEKKHSSMILEHNINYKYIDNFEIIGALYLYRPLELINKNKIYVIDVLYYNTIIRKDTKYKLNFLFYNLNYYFDLKENIEINTNQTISEDLENKLILNYENIYKYIEKEKKYIYIHKENINKTSEILNINKNLDERYFLKNKILLLEKSYIGLKNIYNTSNMIHPLLETIIINSYDLSFKLGEDNLEETIIECITNKNFKDVDGKTCKDYKEICKNPDELINMDSELINLIKRKGIEQLSALSECCACGGGKKNILLNIDKNLYNYNIYYYLELDINSIIELRRKLIYQLSDLYSNINLTKKNFIRMIKDFYILGDNLENILLNKKDFDNAKQILLDAIKHRKIYNRGFIKNVDTNFENLRRKIENMSKNIEKTINEINDLILSLNKYSSYYYNKIYNEIDKIFDLIKDYGYIFNQSYKDVKNYCFNKNFLYVETSYKYKNIREILSKSDTNYYMSKKKIPHNHYTSSNKMNISEKHLEDHDDTIPHKYYFYKTSKKCDETDENKIKNFVEDMYDIKNIYEKNLNILDIFILNEKQIIDMFNTIESFYEYIIKKSLSTSKNLTYHTYFEIFFSISRDNEIGFIESIFDESYSRKFEELHELYTIPVSKNVRQIINTGPDLSATFPMKLSQDKYFLEFYNLFSNGNEELLFYNTNTLSEYLNNYIRNTFTDETNNMKQIIEQNKVILIDYCNIYYDFKKNYDKLNNKTIDKKKELKQKNTELNNININSNDMILLDKIKNIEYSIINNYYDINNLTYIFNNSNLELIKELNLSDEIDTQIKLDYFYTFNKFYNLLDVDMTINKGIKLDEYLDNNVLLNNIIIISYLFIINFIINYPKLFFTILESLYGYHEKIKGEIIYNHKFRSLYNFFKYVIYNKLYVSKFFNIDLEDELKIEIISDSTEPLYIYINDIYNKDSIERLKKLKVNILEKLKEEENKEIIVILNIINYYFSNTQTKRKTYFKQTSENNNNQKKLYNMYFDKYINLYNLYNSNKLNLLYNYFNYYNIINIARKIKKYTIVNELNNNNIFYCTDSQKLNEQIYKKIDQLEFNECPKNLPYNYDQNISQLLNNYGTNYYIFSKVNIPNKKLIFKNNNLENKIVYNKINFTQKSVQMNLWNCVFNYKELIYNTHTDKKLFICKLHNSKTKNVLLNDFYLNNFNANNTISGKLLSNNKNYFPNSEQLYYKKDNNDFFIYYIKNEIEYYLYLNIENKEQLTNNYEFDIDVVFRKVEDMVDIKYSKWALIPQNEYQESVFSTTSTSYNIRSMYNMTKEFGNKYNIASFNFMLNYKNKLTNYLNEDNITSKDAINKYSFTLDGYNNKYNIYSNIENEYSIFKKDRLYHIIDYFKLIKAEKNVENKMRDNYNIEQESLTIDKLNKKFSYYLIKDSKTNQYLYMNRGINTKQPIIEFRDLFNIDKENNKFSPDDNIPIYFLWMITSGDLLLNYRLSLHKQITNNINTYSLSYLCNYLDINIPEKNTTYKELLYLYLNKNLENLPEDDIYLDSLYNVYKNLDLINLFCRNNPEIDGYIYYRDNKIRKNILVNTMELSDQHSNQKTLCFFDKKNEYNYLSTVNDLLNIDSITFYFVMDNSNFKSENITINISPFDENLIIGDPSNEKDTTSNNTKITYKFNKLINFSEIEISISQTVKKETIYETLIFNYFIKNELSDFYIHYNSGDQFYYKIMKSFLKFNELEYNKNDFYKNFKNIAKDEKNTDFSFYYYRVTFKNSLEMKENNENILYELGQLFNNNYINMFKKNTNELLIHNKKTHFNINIHPYTKNIISCKIKHIFLQDRNNIIFKLFSIYNLTQTNKILNLNYNLFFIKKSDWIKILNIDNHNKQTEVLLETLIQYSKTDNNILTYINIITRNKNITPFKNRILDLFNEKNIETNIKFEDTIINKYLNNYADDTLVKKYYKIEKQPVNKKNYIYIVNTQTYNKGIENNNNYISDTFNFMIVDKSDIEKQTEQINLHAYITFIFNKKMNDSYIIYSIKTYMLKYYIQYLKNLIVLPFKNLLTINKTKVVYKDKIKDNYIYILINNFLNNISKIYKESSNVNNQLQKTIEEYLIYIKKTDQNKIRDAINDFTYYLKGNPENFVRNVKNTKYLEIMFYNLINSDSSILFYIIDYFMKIVIKINIQYQNYTNSVNNLLNKDIRFKNNVKYISKNYIDILYDYYSINNNILKTYDYGFYYKFKDDFINYIINGKDTIYILSYDLLTKYTKKIGNKNVLYTKVNSLNNKYQNIYNIYIENTYNEIDNVLNIKYTRIKKNIETSIPIFNNSTYYISTYQNNTFYYLKCNPINYSQNYNNVKGTSDIDKFNLINNHLDTHSSIPINPTIFKIKYEKNKIRFIPFLESNSLNNDYDKVYITEEYDIFYSNNRYQIKNSVTGKNLSIRNNKLVFDTKNNFIWNLIPVETFYKVSNTDYDSNMILSNTLNYDRLPKEIDKTTEASIDSNSNYIYSLSEFIQYKYYKIKTNKVVGNNLSFTKYIKSENRFIIDFTENQISEGNYNNFKLYINLISNLRYKSMSLNNIDGSNKNLFNINETSKYKYLYSIMYYNDKYYPNSPNDPPQHDKMYIFIKKNMTDFSNVSIELRKFLSINELIYLEYYYIIEVSKKDSKNTNSIDKIDHDKNYSLIYTKYNDSNKSTSDYIPQKILKTPFFSEEYLLANDIETIVKDNINMLNDRIINNKTNNVNILNDSNFTFNIINTEIQDKMTFTSNKPDDYALIMGPNTMPPNDINSTPSFLLDSKHLVSLHLGNTNYYPYVKDNENNIIKTPILETINYKNFNIPNTLDNNISNILNDMDIYSGDLVYVNTSISNSISTMLNNYIPKFTYTTHITGLKDQIDIKPILKWTGLNNIKNIQLTDSIFTKFSNFNLNMYSVCNYFKLLMNNKNFNNYITNDLLLLKEIQPYNNYNNIDKNICYFTTSNNNIYLNINDYKYNIFIDNIIDTNLFIIYKIEYNIKYYVEFHIHKNKSYFKWVQESISKSQDLINKLIYINIDKKLNIENVNSSKIVNINPIDKIFKLQYSFLNKYIRNMDTECSLEQIYYTIHNKQFNTIIPKDKHNYLYNYFKVNLFYDNHTKNITLKTNIKNDITLSYFKLNNLNIKQYILYNSFKNIIIKYDIITINNSKIITFNYNNIASYDDIFKKIKDYNIFNLRMNKEYVQDSQTYLSFEIKVENETFINNNIFINAKCSEDDEQFKSCDENEFLLYIKDGSGVLINIFDLLYPDNSNNIYNKTFKIITHNPTNSKLAITNILDENYEDPLFLKPVSLYSPYYFLMNSDGNYLYADKSNIYISDKTLPIISIKTSNNVASIDNNYLFYIKPNILGVIPNNNIHTKCLQGGKLKGGNLIGNTNLKLDDYINDILIENRLSTTRKYNLCYNNTIINFNNFNLLNINSFSKLLKTHYNNNKCFIDKSINYFKYNLLDKNNIYTTTALVSHQKSNINVFQHIFNLFNYPKVSNTNDTLEVPNINKKIQFLNYTDNRDLWNINSDNISFENTTFNIDKYYIKDPNNPNKLYKIVTYNTTNASNKKYKNNIQKLESLDGGNNIGITDPEFFTLLSVDNIKLSNIYMKMNIKNNKIYIEPYTIEQENLYTIDSRKKPNTFSINIEDKFTNDNSDSIKITKNVLYLPINRTYRFDQTIRYDQAISKNTVNDCLILSIDNNKAYINYNEVDYFIDNNRIIDINNFRFTDGNSSRYIIFNPKKEGVYYLKNSVSGSNIETVTIYTYYDNKYSHNINDYFNIIANIYNLSRNYELSEDLRISDMRVIKIDYNWLSRDPKDLIKNNGNHYIFDSNLLNDSKNHLIYPDSGDYNQKISLLNFPNNNIYKLINNNSFYETKGYKLEDPDGDAPTINKDDANNLNFTNFHYSNYYIDLLNMKKNNSININEYLLSSGYYFYINYHLNNNSKPASNYILFTNSKLYVYDTTRNNMDFTDDKYETCKNFKINIEYINNINSIFYYKCTDENNNIEDIKKPELNDMSSNSLYPILYNDTRELINNEFSKYARINSNYINTIIIPIVKINTTEDDTKTLHYPVIELNYKKNQKIFNTDLLYNINPYNTNKYINAKIPINDTTNFIKLKYTNLKNNIPLNNYILLDDNNNEIRYLYTNHVYIVEILNTKQITETESIIKIKSDLYSIIVNNIPLSISNDLSSNFTFGDIYNISILKKNYNSNLFVTNNNKNIHENIGLITNNTTFKIVKNNNTNINSYIITSLNSKNISLRFECIILAADNVKDSYYILSYNKNKYTIPELRVHFWTDDSSKSIENNYYSIINGFSIKTTLTKNNFLFTIKNYKYNKLLKNINKNNKFLLDRNIYSFNKQYQKLIPLSKQIFKLNNLKSNFEYYITINIKINDDNYIYYLCVNNDIIGDKYPLLKNNKNDFILLKKNIDTSQDYPYKNLYSINNVNTTSPRIFNNNTSNKNNIPYLLDDNLRWMFYKNNDNIDKSRFYNKVIDKYITESDIKKYIILNLLSTDIQLANNISEEIFYNDTNYEINYDIISTQYRGNIYSKLESGKYYRIGNKGLNKLLSDEKLYLYYDYRSDNKYLASDYSNILFDNKYNSDPSIWLCVKNPDQTYSFICNSDNTTVLKSYKDNISKFYISHNSDYYYNMFYSTSLYNKYLSLNTPLSDDNKYIMENNENTVHKLHNKKILIQNECIKYIQKNNEDDSLFNDDLGYYLLPKDFDFITSKQYLNKSNSIYTTLGYYLKQNSKLYNILDIIDLPPIPNKTEEIIISEYNKYSASHVLRNEPFSDKTSSNRPSHGSGRLNGSLGWFSDLMHRNLRTSGGTPIHWWQVDLDVIQNVAGVVTQGRNNVPTQYVSSFKVRVSKNNVDWINVDNDKKYTVGHATKNTYFNEPIKARYLRIYPQTYVGAPVIRSAVIINNITKYESELLILKDDIKNSYKRIITNSDMFTTQLNIKENAKLDFNIYLDIHEMSEENNICPPPIIKENVKYTDNIYKYNGDKELPDYLYMKNKTNNLKQSSKYVSDMTTISSIETLNNNYNKNIIKFGINNNENKKRELINTSSAVTVNNILNTTNDDISETNMLNDTCKNHYKFINITIVDKYEIELSIKQSSSTNKILLCPSVNISNIIKEKNNNIVISVDNNKFLNIYLNSILIIDTNIKEYLINTKSNTECYIKQIIMNNTDNINNIYYWKHETLKNNAIWNTKTIKINSENGIKCMSNINKNIYLDFTLEYYSKGIYYIKDNNNNYLCISNEANIYPDYNFDLNNIELLDSYIEWINIKDIENIKKNNIKRLLWNIYEIDDNLNKYLNIKMDNDTPYDFNKFVINFEDLKDISDKKLWSEKDIENNVMLEIDDMYYLNKYNINEFRTSQVKLDYSNNQNDIECSWRDNELFNNSFSYKLDNDNRRFSATKIDIEYIIGRKLKEKDFLTIKQKNRQADVEFNIIKKSYMSENDKSDDIVLGYWKSWEQIKDWNRFNNTVLVKSDPNTFDISHDHVCIGINEDKKTAFCKPQGLISDNDRITGFDFNWKHEDEYKIIDDQYISGAYKCFNNNLGPNLDYNNKDLGLQGILFGEGNCEDYNNQSIYDLENMYIEKCDNKQILNLSSVSNVQAIKEIDCSIKNANSPTDINNNICSLDSDCPTDYTCAKKNDIEGYCVKECATSSDCPSDTPICGNFHPFDNDKTICNVDINKFKVQPTMTGGSTDMKSYNQDLVTHYSFNIDNFKQNTEFLFERNNNNDLYYYIGHETYVKDLENINLNDYLDTDILCQIINSDTQPAIKTSSPEDELQKYVLYNTFNTYDGYLIEQKPSGEIIYKLYKLPNNLILNIYNVKLPQSNGYGCFKYNNLTKKNIKIYMITPDQLNDDVFYNGAGEGFICNILPRPNSVNNVFTNNRKYFKVSSIDNKVYKDKYSIWYDINMNTCKDYSDRNICLKQHMNYSESTEDSKNKNGTLNYNSNNYYLDKTNHNFYDLKNQVFNNIDYRTIINDNSFERFNSELSLLYNVKNNRFLETNIDNSKFNNYNYLTSSVKYNSNIDFSDPKNFQNSRMFATISPLFNLYKPENDSDNPYNKLIYSLYSKKLLCTNSENKLLKNNLNIFKYLSETNDRNPIELYPNCLTCDVNDKHHYSKKIDTNMLINIFQPNETEITLPKINNYISYNYLYVNKHNSLSLILKAYNSDNNKFDRYINLENKDKFIDYNSTYKNVLLFRYNSSTLKLFINTNNTQNINSTTLKNYIENTGNSVIYEDITSNITTNKKYNIMFEYDMEKEGFYIYYIKNSNKYYLIDSNILQFTENTLENVTNYTKIATDNYCNGELILRTDGPTSVNINEVKAMCDVNPNCEGFTYWGDGGYRTFDNCDIATETSANSHSFKKNTGKFDFIANDLDRRQLFRFYDLDDKDITKNLVIYDNQTTNPFYIGKTNKKFCNQSPTIQNNTKYDIPVGMISSNKTFKECLNECINDPACMQLTFNNIDHENNINNDGKCYHLNSISKIDENIDKSSDIIFDFNIGPLINNTNIFECNLTINENSNKINIEILGSQQNIELYIKQLVQNVKFRFILDTLPTELNNNILYTINNIDFINNSTISINIKNINNITSGTFTNKIELMPYFMIDYSIGTNNMKLYDRISHEPNNPVLVVLNNCIKNIPYYYLLNYINQTIANTNVKEINNNRAFYISYSHRINSIEYYELFLYPNDTSAFIKLDDINNVCLSGKINKIDKNISFYGGNSEENIEKQELSKIETNITNICQNLEEQFKNDDIKPCDIYNPSDTHVEYALDNNILNLLNSVKTNIQEYNTKIKTLTSTDIITQDYSNIDKNINIMISTLTKLKERTIQEQIRQKTETDIRNLLKQDKLNKSQLKKILADADSQKINLEPNIINDIRKKLSNSKWKPKDWVSADCNIKECSEEEKNNSPPIIESKNSYKNYLFEEYQYDPINNEYVYYNKHTQSYLAMDNTGNVYALYALNEGPTQKPQLINTKYINCIFKKINLGKGDALSVCSICNDTNNVEIQEKNIKKPIVSVLKGIKSIHNISKSEYNKYLIVKNNNLYNKYKNILHNHSVGTSNDEVNFINNIFKDKLDVSKYLIKFRIDDTNNPDNESYKKCVSRKNSVTLFDNKIIYNKLVYGKIKFLNNDGSELDDDSINIIKTIFEDYTFLPNMVKIPQEFVSSSKKILNYLVNLMVLKFDNTSSNTDNKFNYDDKYQIYIIADKSDNISDFKDNIKIYTNFNKNINCPAVINQNTGQLIKNYKDTDVFNVINIPHIFKFYSIKEKDKIILEEMKETDENVEEVCITIQNILSNKITLFSNKSSDKILTKEETDLILTKEQTKRLTRQKNAWKIQGGKNFNGDTNKLFNKLEIVKDTNYSSDDLTFRKPLNNLDFNKTLVKIKFNYIKGDRGWKISNNSIFNKHLFNEQNFDKISEGELTYKYPVNFNINDKIYNSISNNKLDIEKLFENILYDKWFFEEVSNLTNKPKDYKNNPILLSYLNNNNIDTVVEGEISHSLIENNYIIISKLFETSELIYNDLTLNYLKQPDLYMNLYYYKKPTEKSIYNDLNYTDFITQMQKLYYGENVNINDAKKIYINYINNKYLKDNINNNLILTNNIYGSNFTDINYIFKFTKVEDVNEGYKINYLDNNISFTDKNLTYQIIKQTGNYEGYYIIKDIQTDTYMYVDNIDNINDIKTIKFDKPIKLSNKYLFKIETKNYKKPLPTSAIRKDLLEGNYNIKLYKSSSYLHTLLSTSKIEFYLDKLENIFKLNNKNLNNNLQSTYSLEDNTSVFEIITEYIPFYSNNYLLFVIRDKNNPSNILYVEDNVPIWITYSIENLIKNKEVLEKSLWIFEKKITGGSKNPSNNNCIIC